MERDSALAEAVPTSAAAVPTSTHAAGGSPSPPSCRRRSHTFWDDLGRPRCVVSPMVDQSELAFRMLCRRYHGGAPLLCYTPMIHSSRFVKDRTYRRSLLQSCGAEDRPLIAQICGHDPDILVAASKLIAGSDPTRRPDAVDLNLGCPENIARKGRYGSFLLREPVLVVALVRALVDSVALPITCKIRIMDESNPDSDWRGLPGTIRLVRALQGAGVSAICVHARNRHNKGPKTSDADWAAIKAIKEAVGPGLPIIANGNIATTRDVRRCLAVTGCDAVMSAEALLVNPALFAPLGAEEAAAAAAEAAEAATAGNGNTGGEADRARVVADEANRSSGSNLDGESKAPAVPQQGSAAACAAGAGASAGADADAATGAADTFCLPAPLHAYHGYSASTMAWHYLEECVRYPPPDFNKSVKLHLYRLLYKLLRWSPSLEAALMAATDVAACFDVVRDAVPVEKECQEEEVAAAATAAAAAEEAEEAEEEEEEEEAEGEETRDEDGIGVMDKEADKDADKEGKAETPAAVVGSTADDPSSWYMRHRSRRTGHQNDAAMRAARAARKAHARLWHEAGTRIS